MKSIIKKALLKLKGQKVVANFINLSSIQLSNVILLSLLFPIITQKIGIEEFGIFMFANTFSNLASIFINYGTNQSGIRDVAVNNNNIVAQNKVVNDILYIRLVVFVLYLVLLIALKWLKIQYYDYVILAIPIVFAEVLNPLFFFIGIEKLKLYNQANLVSKILSIALILLFVQGPKDSILVNFILGISSVLIYVYLLFYILKNKYFHLKAPSIVELKGIGKENLHLTISSVSVQLQQSLMIFLLARMNNPLLLGSYSLCDKVVWSVRMLIVSISTSIYPKSAQLLAEGIEFWKAYKKRFKKLITFSFLALSVFLFVFSDLIILILSGEHNTMASNFLKMMALVPTVSALNSLNVIELLIKKENEILSKTAIFLSILSLIVAWLLTTHFSTKWTGSYTITIELISLIIYEFLIRRSSKRYV